MHTDPELLGLLALGEDAGTEDERSHAQSCQECAGELAQLHRVVRLGRSVSVETALASPSQHVWSRIREELDFSLTLEPPPPAAQLSANATFGTQIGSKSARRSVLAVIKSALAGPSRGSHDGLTAHAQLMPVDAMWSDASGTAELATDEHGRRLLQVALHADLPSSGIRQAWLVHRDDASVRQSLGMLDGSHGLWTVEHSIDLQDFGILEISQQEGGATGYSGQTIVRGELTLAS